MMDVKRNVSWEAEETFFSKRIDLGDIWVVTLKGTSAAERLFMRTLQGLVNKETAQLYLVNSDNKKAGPSEKFWIEEYERQGWVSVAGYLTIDEAIEKFTPLISGYVTAAEEEPWSIHVAVVIAILNNGVVAPDLVAQRLNRIGLVELDNTCGRWSDPVSAYEEMVDKHRDDLAYPGIALVDPKESLWDFIIQQQIMPMYTRPKHESWDGVASIMDTYPSKQILYGYVSDDTVEEEIAVERASSSGKYLVPTSNVSNLSVHSAVLGKGPLKSIEPKIDIPLLPLDLSQVNVAIAITDGDNLQVPILQYPTDQFWNGETRGSMPLGWSMGVSLSTLAPGIWEYYRNSIRTNDEIVSIMGIAYVHASTLPEPEQYFRATFSSMKDMGLTTLWSLDSSLTITDEPLWDVLEKAPSRDALEGVVIGYGPSIDKAFRRDSKTPVLITQNGYSDDVHKLKERIEEMIALDISKRSPVNFLMATNWNMTAEEIYHTLKPLEAKGVRFLTPSQALRLMPNIKGLATSTVDQMAEAGMCMPTGKLEQFGTPILSAPTLAEINKPIPMPLKITVKAPKAVKAGETIEITVDIDINVSGLAKDFLNYRVLPVVEGYGLSEEFAEFAWMKLDATNIVVDIKLPEKTIQSEKLTIDCENIKAVTTLDLGKMSINMDAFSSDSRIEGPSIKVSTKTSLILDGKLDDLDIVTDSITFDFSLTVGIGDEGGPLVGGVRGKMSGKV